MSDKKAVNYTDLYIAKNYIDDKVGNLKTSITEGTLKAKLADSTDKDGEGNIITDTYYKKTDTIENATNASFATNADLANSAIKDGNGNIIDTTYQRKDELAENALKVNGIEFNRRKNGVLIEVGSDVVGEETVVPQKKLLWNYGGGSREFRVYKGNIMIDIDLGEDLTGKILEIWYRFYNTKPNATKYSLGMKKIDFLIDPIYGSSSFTGTSFLETLRKNADGVLGGIFINFEVQNITLNKLRVSLNGIDYLDEYDVLEIYDIYEVIG